MTAEGYTISSTYVPGTQYYAPQNSRPTTAQRPQAHQAHGGGQAPAGWYQPGTCRCSRQGCTFMGSKKAVDIHMMDRHLVYPPGWEHRKRKNDWDADPSLKGCAHVLTRSPRGARVLADHKLLSGSLYRSRARASSSIRRRLSRSGSQSARNGSPLPRMWRRSSRRCARRSNVDSSRSTTDTGGSGGGWMKEASPGGTSEAGAHTEAGGEGEDAVEAWTAAGKGEHRPNRKAKQNPRWSLASPQQLRSRHSKRPRQSTPVQIRIRIRIRTQSPTAHQRSSLQKLRQVLSWKYRSILLQKWKRQAKTMLRATASLPFVLPNNHTKNPDQSSPGNRCAIPSRSDPRCFGM